jgi:hypothetical protein
VAEQDTEVVQVVLREFEQRYLRKAPVRRTKLLQDGAHNEVTLTTCRTTLGGNVSSCT